MIRLFVLASLVVSCWASFICPPNRQIHPCECLALTHKVRCDDVFNLATVRTSLGGRFENPFRLYLTNVHSYSLSAKALGDLPIRFLSLMNSNIRHIDADAFDGQIFLQGLLLTDDRIEDIPIKALQTLPLLRTLSLAGNFLMDIPDRSLDGFVHLKFLVLAYNRISDIGKNAFPRSLEIIQLSHNHLNTLNGSLNYLGNLTDIYLTDNRLTSIRGELDGLSRLQTLSLDRNHIRDLSDSLSGLKSLARLSLSGNRIQDVGKDLVELEQLRLLNLSHNYISELHWRMFEKLGNLQVLDLSGNYLKSICPALKPLRSLGELRLSHLGLEYLQPDCFRNMKSLASLDLSHNRLASTESISRHPLPNLSHLKLNNNHLATLKYEMKYAKRLQELDIGFNSFGSLKASQFANNRELIALRMEGKNYND